MNKIICKLFGHQWMYYEGIFEKDINGKGCERCGVCLIDDRYSIIHRSKIKNKIYLLKNKYFYILPKRIKQYICGIIGHSWEHMPNVNQKYCLKCRKSEKI